MIRPVRPLLSFALVLVASCSGDPVQPRPVEGTYGAVQANGSALPTNILTYPSGDGVRLLQGSLTLQTPDTLVAVLRTQYVGPSGSGDAPVSDTLRALYTVNGSALELSRLGSRPLEFESPGTISSDGSIRLTALRRLPPSAGFVGTYPVELFFRR